MNKYEVYKNVLLENGITLLVDEQKFTSSQNKYDFKCEKLHIWNARLSDVINKGLKRESKGCPHCAKEITDSISKQAVDKNLLENHKIKSFSLKITDKKKNRKERFYKVECPHGHEYEKRSSKLQEGCPQCSIGVFVGEERVRVILETHFNKPFSKIRPEWLRNPNTQSKMELDGYNDELKIAFEYQGRQHYSNNTQFAGEQEQQSVRDNLKNTLCKQKNIKLYILDQPVSYAEDKFVESIIEQFKEQDLIINSNISFCFKDINNDISLKNKYNEFKNIVEEQNITLLSSTLSTMEDELDFECKNGHQFKLNGLKFKEIIKGDKGRDYFCIECEKSNENTSATFKSSISIDSLKEFAKSIGYELISTNYHGVIKPMKWKCNNGHVFEKPYRSFQRNKTGCYCDECITEKIVEKKINNTGRFTSNNGEIINLDSIKKFAKSINYEVLSTKYENITSPMKWRCANGHIFEKNYRTFKRNNTGCYCDECKKEGIIENSSYKKVIKDNKGTQIDGRYLKEFATEKNLEWIETEYKNVNTLMDWKCKNGHLFTQTLRNIQRNKSGLYCSFCKK